MTGIQIHLTLYHQCQYKQHAHTINASVTPDMEMEDGLVCCKGHSSIAVVQIIT